MRVVRGRFNGTGAVVNVGIGFIPSYVKLWNLTEATQLYTMGEWQEFMRGAIKTEEGYWLGFVSDTEGDAGDNAVTEGIKVYAGGDVGDSTETYLIADPEPDKRAKGAGAAIDTWTLGSVTNRTGNWNAVANITYPDNVGVGSIINIDSGSGAKQYWVQAITGNGEAANEVTINIAAPSGKITFLGGINTHIQCPATLVMPAGFTVAALAALNTNDEIMAFEAYGD